MALLLTLVVMTLASVLALSMLEQANRSIARTQAVVDRSSVNALSDGMALLAQRGLDEWQALTDQGKLSRGIDEWTPAYPVPGGMIQGRLVDLGGRFNLNALLHSDPNKRRYAQAVFERLNRALNLDPGAVLELSQWLNTRQMSPSEMGRSPWDGAGNQQKVLPLMHLSELREWPGYQANVYEAWAPHVVVLPSTELVVNVNRASEAVLVALFSGLDLSQAERILLDRPFEDLASFWAQPIIQSLVLNEHQQQSVVVRSDWYLAQARVTLDQTGQSGGVSYDVFRLMSASGSGYDFRYVSQGTP